MLRSLGTLLFLAVAVPAGSEELVKIARLPAGNDIGVGVQLMTPQVAWCAYEGRLWQTTNAGQNWREIQLPVPKGAKAAPNEFSFGFLDTRTAWFLWRSSLYWTMDAGATWSQPNELPISHSNPKAFINSLAFADGTTGWLLGTHSVRNPRLFERGLTRGRWGLEPGEIGVPIIFNTQDAGKTWNRQVYPDVYDEYGSFQIADAQHVLIAELNGLAVTVNGGRLWKRAKLSPACTDIKHLHFAEHGSGTGSGNSVFFLKNGKNAWWTREGDSFHSADGGQNWCQLPSVFHGKELIAFAELAFADPHHGWAISRQIGRSDPPLPPYATRDGGVHWEQFRLKRSAEPLDVCGMSVLDAEHVWMWDCDRNVYRVVP